MRPRPSRAVRLTVTLLLASACTRSGTATDRAGTSAAGSTGAAATSTPAPMDQSSGAPNTLTAEERAAGWRLLFDGTTTRGWRGYGRPTMPDGWTAVDGALTRTGAGGDIVSDSVFRDFELSLEWKVEKGGNSGIFYRAVEGPNPIWHSAIEMQVLDDAAHADGQNPLTSAGSAFALFPAPRGAVKPAGEWNQARVVARGPHVEHWLNGRQVAAFEIGSADWNARVAASKFKPLPAFGTAREGHIGLQDHGDRVAFRSIKLRVLP